MLSTYTANHYPLRITTSLSATSRGIAKAYWMKNSSEENIASTTLLGSSSATTMRSSSALKTINCDDFAIAAARENARRNESHKRLECSATLCSMETHHPNIGLTPAKHWTRLPPMDLKRRRLQTDSSSLSIWAATSNAITSRLRSTLTTSTPTTPAPTSHREG